MNKTLFRFGIADRKGRIHEFLIDCIAGPHAGSLVVYDPHHIHCIDKFKERRQNAPQLLPISGSYKGPAEVFLLVVLP